MTDRAPPPEAAPPDAGAAAELARLRREIVARDDLLALAAHELRNPLHAMSLHLALARTLATTACAEDVAERIARAERTLKRYAERVTVLMELLSAPGAVYPLSPQSTDLGTLLQSLAESLDEEARSRRIELRVVQEDAARPRAVDPVAFEQVVDNLLLNAFKHSGATRVVLRLQSDAGEWVVRVEDNGTGIAPSDQQAIFEKSIVARHSARGAGTGLGLWIVTRLVQAMGGRVALDSAPGRGSTFSIRVPESPEPPPRPATR